MREIYADHAATSPPAVEVIAAMQPYLTGRFGNASSVHRRGEAARDAIGEARARVASLLGATAEEIVFTASGSEANNLALSGVMSLAPDRRCVVVSAIEHPSVLETARHLESRGVKVTVVPVGADGVVDVGDIERALRDEAALVSVMWVNNEVGTVQPVAEIARLAHERGALFHCDAVQAAGRLPIDVAAAGCDLLTLAAHKIAGPQGAAALYVRRRVRIEPLVHGGHQERSRRAGTENLAAIAGFGVAADRAATRIASGIPEHTAALGERLMTGFAASIPGARLNGDRDRRVGAIVNVCVPGVDGEALLHELDRLGITISTGSACSAATPGPSHVLTAMGLRPEDAHASVRFSLGEETAPSDIDRIVAATTRAVEALRGMNATTERRREELGR